MSAPRTPERIQVITSPRLPLIPTLPAYFPKKRFLLPLVQLVFHIISWPQRSWVGLVPWRGLGGGNPCAVLGRGKGTVWRRVSDFASTTQNSVVLSGPQFPHWAPGRVLGKSSPSRCLKCLRTVAWLSPRGPTSSPAPPPAQSPPHPPEKKIVSLKLPETCGCRNHKLI